MLISVMRANNEVGTVQPVAEVGLDLGSLAAVRAFASPLVEAGSMP